jgi:hypothetical protein
MAVTLTVDLGDPAPKLGKFPIGTAATLNGEPVTLADFELRELMMLLSRHGQG